MNDFNRAYSAGAGADSMDTSVNAGLRSFMLGVYQKLALGIGLAGAIAFSIGTVPALTDIFVKNDMVRMFFQFAPMAILLGTMFFMRRPSPMSSGILYWTIVTMLGVCLSIWVAAATGQIEMARRGGQALSPAFVDIGKAFFITAAAFGGLSLFGYTTKTNLRPIGVFAVYAIIGIILLSLVSLFFPPSNMLVLAIQAAVLVLSGILIAFDTQMLKEGYFDFQGDTRSLAVMTNQGALGFFISFYNIFQILMSFLSSD